MYGNWTNAVVSWCYIASASYFYRHRKTHKLTMESVHYESVKFYNKGPESPQTRANS